MNTISKYEEQMEYLTAMFKDRDIATEVIYLFLKEIDSWIENSEDAIKNSDDIKLARLTHKLRGSILYFNEPELKSELRKLEEDKTNFPKFKSLLENFKNQMYEG